MPLVHLNAKLRQLQNLRNELIHRQMIDMICSKVSSHVCCLLGNLGTILMPEGVAAGSVVSPQPPPALFCRFPNFQLHRLWRNTRAWFGVVNEDKPLPFDISQYAISYFPYLPGLGIQKYKEYHFHHRLFTINPSSSLQKKKTLRTCDLSFGFFLFFIPLKALPFQNVIINFKY